MINIDTETDTPLIEAARQGRVDEVRSLIDRGAALDDIGEENGTAICWAAWEGHAHVVDVLLEAGANLYLGGGPGRWAFQSAYGPQWDVLSVTRADADLNALWRNAGLPIERRDNYTMTELTVQDAPEMRANLIDSGEGCGRETAIALATLGLEAIEQTGSGPAAIAYTDFTADFSSYLEEDQTSTIAIYASDPAGVRVLSPIRCARVLVKGPLTQLGFAHYSLRRAAALAGLIDLVVELREIYHYYEAPASDGNITELQLAVLQP